MGIRAATTDRGSPSTVAARLRRRTAFKTALRSRYTYESPTGSTGNPTSRALTDALFAPMPLFFVKHKAEIT